MCGICGIIGSGNDDLAESRVREMMRRIEHRGPDEDGVLVRRRAVLGMRRLSIIDLGGGSQPVYNEDGTVGVVFNGEIYNFPRAARGAREPRPPVSHPLRHRSDRSRLRGMGRALPRASPRDVCLRAVGRPRRTQGRPSGRPGSAGSRSAGHQAALLRRGGWRAALRLRSARAAGQRSDPAPRRARSRSRPICSSARWSSR